MKATSIRSLVLVAAVCALAIPARGEDGADKPWQVGIRGMITAANGEPANDMIGAGVFARKRTAGPYLVGLSIDQYTFDFEEPARIVGLDQDNSESPIDATTDATVISAWVEREYGESSLRWFWQAGLGIGFLTTEDAAGPLEGGGTFDIETDSGTEFVPQLGLGLRYGGESGFFAELAARAEEHFAEWDVSDRNSGADATIEDYHAFGGYGAIGFAF